MTMSVSSSLSRSSWYPCAPEGITPAEATDKLGYPVDPLLSDDWPELPEILLLRTTLLRWFTGLTVTIRLWLLAIIISVT